jgi:hypothetical protein
MKRNKIIIRRSIMSEQKNFEYMLLFRGTDWNKGLSPEEIQQVITDMYAWFDRLTEQGKLKAGQPLELEGKIVSEKKGRRVVDGPFAESKEAIGGYFLLLVDSLDEAVEIARDFPALKYGATVEVRPVAPECTMKQILGQESEEKLAQASA